MAKQQNNGKIRPSTDLADLDTQTRAERGVPMPVVHPVTREPIIGADGNQWTVTVLGKDSIAFRKALHARTAAAIEAGDLPKNDDPDLDELPLVVCLVTGWSPMKWNGEPFLYSPANAEKLLKERRWLRVQVDLFTGKRENYLGN